MTQMEDLPQNSGSAVNAAKSGEQKKNVDEWLPVTGSRKANWMASAYHNVTAMVGAGVLSLPYALAHMGWGPGVTILFVSWMITLYTLWQMVEMHEMVPGKRFDRYHELGQHAFGEKLGLYLIIPQQLIVQVGTNIVYMVTGGKTLQKVQELICPSCKPFRASLWTVVFASFNFVLAHLPNFESITIVSVAAAVMSIVYSVLAWSTCIVKGVAPDVDYSLKGSNQQDKVFRFFSALGDIAFAYAGHNVVLEIQATIPSTPETPSKVPMWKGVAAAYAVVAFCYFPVAIIGYYVFGNAVDDDILLSLQKPSWLIAAANFFVFIHIVGGYQIFAMPVFDMMETFLVKQMKLTPSFRLRLISRTGYVAFTMIVGISVPFFGELLGLFGGFAFAPTSYYIPCIIWLKLHKPKPFSLSWTINWICIVLGVILMILSPIGALRTLIVSSKNNKFFS